MCGSGIVMVLDPRSGTRDRRSRSGGLGGGPRCFVLIEIDIKIIMGMKIFVLISTVRSMDCSIIALVIMTIIIIWIMIILFLHVWIIPVADMVDIISDN